MSARASVRIIHGGIGSGKTRRVAHWVEQQGLAGRRVAGVLALKTPDGRRFQDVATGEDVPLEHPAEDEATVTVGRFTFRQAAFDWAISRIEAAVAGGTDAVVVDEVGPLELRGEGFADLLDRLTHDHPAIEQVLLVRTGLIKEVTERFAGDADLIFDPPL